MKSLMVSKHSLLNQIQRNSLLIDFLKDNIIYQMEKVELYIVTMRSWKCSILVYQSNLDNYDAYISRVICL